MTWNEHNQVGMIEHGRRARRPNPRSHVPVGAPHAEPAPDDPDTLGFRVARRIVAAHSLRHMREKNSVTKTTICDEILHYF